MSTEPSSIAIRSDPETYAVVGAAMAVHTALGCGFLEKVYGRALMMEFTSRGIPFTREARFSIEYNGKPLGLTFCPDFVCFNTVIVETKAVKLLTALDLAQTLNYLKASKVQAGAAPELRRQEPRVSASCDVVRALRCGPNRSQPYARPGPDLGISSEQ